MNLAPTIIIKKYVITEKAMLNTTIKTLESVNVSIKGIERVSIYDGTNATTNAVAAMRIGPRSGFNKRVFPLYKTKRKSIIATVPLTTRETAKLNKVASTKRQVSSVTVINVKDITS